MGNDIRSHSKCLKYEYCEPHLFLKDIYESFLVTGVYSIKVILRKLNQKVELSALFLVRILCSLLTIKVYFTYHPALLTGA
jgi:hypothetical protein